MKRIEHVLGGPKRDSMWKTLVVMAMGGLLFAGAAAAADAVKSRTFNVRDYGAVGDDKTDNTEAFSACRRR